MDRHIRITQRSPSIEEIVADLERMLQAEKTEAGRLQLEHYLEYWRGRLSTRPNLQREVFMNNLKKIRTEKGFSQLTLAKLTNIAPGVISGIENNWLRPYHGWCSRLAKALCVSEKELFPEG